MVPYARTGIMGSVFLALARALGETMAVTMVVGNNPRIAASLLGPGLFDRLACWPMNSAKPPAICT